MILKISKEKNVILIKLKDVDEEPSAIRIELKANVMKLFSERMLQDVFYRFIENDS